MPNQHNPQHGAADRAGSAPEIPARHKGSHMNSELVEAWRIPLWNALRAEAIGDERCYRIIKAMESALSSLPQGQTELREALEDCRTHRNAWLGALKAAHAAAEVLPPDRDDKSYWQHEIDVFERTFTALLSTPNEVEGK